MWWLWWHTDKRVHDSHESLRTTQHSSDSGNHKSFRSLDIHLPLGHSTDRTECEFVIFFLLSLSLSLSFSLVEFLFLLYFFFYSYFSHFVLLIVVNKTFGYGIRVLEICCSHHPHCLNRLFLVIVMRLFCSPFMPLFIYGWMVNTFIHFFSANVNLYIIFSMTKQSNTIRIFNRVIYFCLFVPNCFDVTILINPF